MLSIFHNPLLMKGYDKVGHKDYLIKSMQSKVNRLRTPLKVYFPIYNLNLNTDSLASMIHVPPTINLNLEMIYDHFYNEVNYMMVQYENQSLQEYFEEIVEGLMWHETGHIWVTVDNETTEAFYKQKANAIPLRFFHFIINIVDDTMLQDFSGYRFGFMNNTLQHLSRYGQGFSSYLYYLKDYQDNLHNKLYFLILHSYKEYHPIFNLTTTESSNRYRLEFINPTNFWTDELLNDFKIIKSVYEKQKRLSMTYDFAEKIYKLLKQEHEKEMRQLSKDSNSDSQTDKESFDQSLDNTIDKLVKDNKLNITKVTKAQLKQTGTSPLKHASVGNHKGDKRPYPITDFYKLAKDSITKLLIENDDGVKRNLKSGTLDTTRIPYSGISNKIFYRVYEEINKPDLSIIAIVDSSGSMSTSVDSKTDLYSYVVKVLVDFESAIINTFNNTKIYNYTFSHEATFVNNNLTTPFNKENTLKLFEVANDGGGTDPEEVLMYVSNTLNSVSTKQKLVIVITDGQFTESNNTKNYIKNIENKANGILVINITDHKFEVFDSPNTTVLNYKPTTIKELYNHMIRYINNKFILKGGD